MDLSRRVGVRGRCRAADRRAFARPIAGDRAAPLAHHRRRDVLLPGGVEHRQHLFGAADSVGPVGGAWLHDAVVVGVDRLGRARRAPRRAAGAGHRIGRRCGGAADVEELCRLRTGAAGFGAGPAGRHRLGRRHTDPAARPRRRAGHRVDRLAAADHRGAHHDRRAAVRRSPVVRAVVVVDVADRLHRVGADEHRQPVLVLDRRPVARAGGGLVVDPGAGGRDGGRRVDARRTAGPGAVAGHGVQRRGAVAGAVQAGCRVRQRWRSRIRCARRGCAASRRAMRPTGACG